MISLEEFSKTHVRDIARNYEYCTKEEDNRRGIERARKRISLNEIYVEDKIGKEYVTIKEFSIRNEYRKKNPNINLEDLKILYIFSKNLNVDKSIFPNEQVSILNAKFRTHGIETKFTVDEIDCQSKLCVEKCSSISENHVSCECLDDDNDPCLSFLHILEFMISRITINNKNLKK